MQAGPLIARELREQSRRPSTHWLRLLGAAGLVLAVYQMLGAPTGRGLRAITTPGGGSLIGEMTWVEVLEFGLRQFEHRGSALFQSMNTILLAGIWIVGPLLTADALSRERREGTMGLLFLTRLRAGDIVIAKLVANLLRSTAVVLAALPVLMLPVVLGGLDWGTVARSAMLDVSALVLALSAGLLASTLWQGPRAVLFGAIFVALGTGAVWAGGWTVVEVFLSPDFCVNRGGAGLVGQALQRRAVSAGSYGAMIAGSPGLVGITTSRIYTRSILQLPAVMAFLGVAGVVAAGVLLFARRAVVRFQREGRPPGGAERTVEWLGRPRYLGALFGRMRGWMLAREPVLWTEFRTWRLRVGIWLMPLAMAPVLVSWVGASAYGHAERVGGPVLLLTILMAMAAASSLHTERATGVLELLLTAPGGAMHVVRGKVGALLLQALPSAALTLAVAASILLGAGMATGGDAAAGRFLCGFAGSVLARVLLMIGAGCFLSLRLAGFLPAFLATLLVAGAVELARLLSGPWMGNGVVPANASLSLTAGLRWLSLQAVWSGIEIVGAGVFVCLLHRALASRRFRVR